MKRLLGLLLVTLLLISCQSNEKNEVVSNGETYNESVKDEASVSNNGDNFDKDVPNDVAEEDAVKDKSSNVEQEPDDILYVLIQVDVLNVRSKPDINSSKMGKTLKGQVYKVIESQKDDEENICIKLQVNMVELAGLPVGTVKS